MNSFSIVTIFALETDRRTDTIRKINDHLFCQGLVGQQEKLFLFNYLIPFEVKVFVAFHDISAKIFFILATSKYFPYRQTFGSGTEYL